MSTLLGKFAVFALLVFSYYGVSQSQDVEEVEEGVKKVQEVEPSEVQAQERVQENNTMSDPDLSQGTSLSSMEEIEVTQTDKQDLSVIIGSPSDEDEVQVHNPDPFESYSMEDEQTAPLEEEEVEVTQVEEQTETEEEIGVAQAGVEEIQEQLGAAQADEQAGTEEVISAKTEVREDELSEIQEDNKVSAEVGSPSEVVFVPNEELNTSEGEEWEEPQGPLEMNGDDAGLWEFIVKRSIISGIDHFEKVNSAVGLNSLSEVQANVVALPAWLGSLFVGYKTMQGLFYGVRRFTPDKIALARAEDYNRYMRDLRNLYSRQVQLEVTKIALVKDAYPSYLQLRYILFQQGIQTEAAYLKFAKRTKSVPQDPSLFYSEWKGFKHLLKPPGYVHYLEASRIHDAVGGTWKNKQKWISLARDSAKREFGVELIRSTEKRGSWVLAFGKPAQGLSPYAHRRLVQRLEELDGELRNIRNQIGDAEFKLNSFFSKPVRRGLLHRAGRLVRSVGLGAVWLAGITAGTYLTADMLYIEFGSSEEMIEVKQQFEADIRNYFTQNNR